MKTPQYVQITSQGDLVTSATALGYPSHEWTNIASARELAPTANTSTVRCANQTGKGERSGMETEMPISTKIENGNEI